MAGAEFGESMGFDMGMFMVGGADGGQAWRGGHEFHAGAAMYSFNHFIIPDITEQHPEWTSQQVHETGIQELTLRLSQDRVKDQQEKDRKPEMVTQWEMTETAPGMYELTTEYGSGRTSLRELWEHTYQIANDKSNPATYNPAAYNNQEAKAQLAMQDALITGEIISFVSVLSHPDSIRYASVWEKTNDGAIISKTIDIGLVAGRDLSMKEATTLVHHMAQFNMETGKEVSESEANYPHVMMARGTVSSGEIKTLVQAQTYFQDKTVETLNATRSSIQADVVAATTKTVHDAVHAVVRESSISAHAMGMFVASEFRRGRVNDFVQQEDNRHKPLFLQLLEGKLDIKKVFASVKPIKPEAHVILERKRDIQVDASRLKRADKKDAKKFFGRDASILTLATKINLGDISLKVQQMPERQKKELTIKREEAKKKIRERSKTFYPFITMEKREKVKRLHKETRKHHTEKKRGRNIFETGVKLPQLVTEDSLNTIIKERNRIYRVIHKKERKLWHILRKLARKQELSVKQELTLRKPKRLGERKMSLVERPVPRSQEKRKEAIFRVSFAWTLWLLLKLSASLEQPKLTGQTKHIDILTTKEVKQEGLIQSEPGQWVLLAIIWYLAMIREQGMSNKPINQYGNTTNKQTNTPFFQNQQFLRHGVIFAFAPGNS